MRNIILIITLTVLAGCKLDLLNVASPSPAGHYTIDKDRTKETIKAFARSEAEKSGQAGTQEPEQQVDPMTEIITSMNFDLKLKEDGTWEGSINFGDTPSIATGTWKLEGEKLILSALHEDGRLLPRPRVDNMVYKNGDIYFTPPKDPSLSFILTRNSS